MAEDVLVIGAGPAGVAAAYYLQAAGIAYKVIDRAHEIAHTWNSLYPSLRLNTTRFFSHLPGKRFPLHYGIFPTGRQYHRYVVHFAQSHRLNIHLNVEVLSIHPENDGWLVRTRQDNLEQENWVPCVISATGRFSTPVQPHFPGEGLFQGEIIHASKYVAPDPFINKRVMVVGNGPSGIDIATELSDYAAAPVYLSQRTGVVLRPRYPLGLPKHLWMIIAEMLPASFAKPLMEIVSRQQYRDVAEAGIKVPKPHEMSTAAGGTRGRAIITAAKAGKVKSVDGLLRFHPHDVELTDGTCLPVDVVMLATGYRPALFDYLPIQDQIRLNEYDWPMRINEPDDVYWQGDREVIGFPGLYLVGIYYQGKGAMYNFNVEAQAAVKEIKQRLATLNQSTQPISE